MHQPPCICSTAAWIVTCDSQPGVIPNLESLSACRVDIPAGLQQVGRADRHNGSCSRFGNGAVNNFDPCAADCPQTGAVNRPGCAQATAQEPIFVAFRAGGRLAFSCRNSPGEHSADFPQHTSMSLAYTDESRFAITWSSSDGTADAAIVTGSHSRQVFRIPTPASNVTDKYVNSLCTRHSTC